jgi:hypothetical protein
MNPIHQQFRRAERESVPVVPIPYRDSFSAEESAQIRAGLVPRSMEEKWFVLFERPYLLFYRSWTGILIYRLEMEEGPDGARVVNATVLDNPEMYRRGSLDDEAHRVSLLVRRLLLGQVVPGDDEFTHD